MNKITNPPLLARRNRVRVVASVAALLSSVSGTIACTNEEVSSPAPGTIAGAIHYNGGDVAPGRPLAIAVYQTFPPTGPPLRSQLVERYQFPYRYEFTGLRPGTYYVGALIDVDRLDTRYAGMLVAGRDPYGYATAAIDAAYGAASVDIALERESE